MEKAYSYSCTFDPNMYSKFSIEFCTSDEETYQKVKKTIDLLLEGVLDLTVADDISIEVESELGRYKE